MNQRPFETPNRGPSTKRYLGYGALAVFTVGAALALTRFTEKQDISTASATSGRTPGTQVDKSIKRRVDQLQREVRTMRQQQQQELPVASTTPTPSEEGPEDTPSATPEQIEVQLDTYLKTEQRDPEWSDDTEQAVTELFGGEAFPGVSLVETACASTMCRVVVDSESDDAHDTFQTQMARTPPFDTEGFARVSGEPDAPRLTFYFAREGEDLRRILQPSAN